VNYVYDTLLLWQRMITTLIWDARFGNYKGIKWTGSDDICERYSDTMDFDPVAPDLRPFDYFTESDFDKENEDVLALKNVRMIKVNDIRCYGRVGLRAELHMNGDVMGYSMLSNNREQKTPSDPHSPFLITRRLCGDYYEKSRDDFTRGCQYKEFKKKYGTEPKKRYRGPLKRRR